MLNGTYAFDSVSDYEKFQDEVKEMGLSDGYTVSSSDLTSYEESLEPLQHLSQMRTFRDGHPGNRGSSLIVLQIFGLGNENMRLEVWRRLE